MTSHRSKLTPSFTSCEANRTNENLKSSVFLPCHYSQCCQYLANKMASITSCLLPAQTDQIVTNLEQFSIWMVASFRELQHRTLTACKQSLLFQTPHLSFHSLKWKYVSMLPMTKSVRKYARNILLKNVRVSILSSFTAITRERHAPPWQATWAPVDRACILGAVLT